METPRLEIDLGKISHNARQLRALYAAKGIGVMAVTKAVCGDPLIARVLVNSGIDVLADSRIENIRRMRQAGIDARFVLLRSPGLSQAGAAVRCADVSLSSERASIEALAAAGVTLAEPHRIILMVELGDLREGIMPAALLDAAELVSRMRGVVLAGIGTNLACFGGVKPDREKMAQLSALAEAIEARLGTKLEYVSGGNSANYDWFMSTADVGGINNLRLGESIFLGCETLGRRPITGLFTDAFKLRAEVIESKVKPSRPYGDIGQAAFGDPPPATDRGEMRRVLLGVGLQDVRVAGLDPDLDIDIIGASSDHVIIDAKASDLRVGDEVGFGLSYAALLSSMTSPYVGRSYVPVATGGAPPPPAAPQRIAGS